MSFNGSGTFLINTAGQPVTSGSTISSTAFNSLTSDLATGLSTCITKDGQTTITANIPFGNNKITGLGAGTLATDAATISQVQGSTVKLITSIAGTNTITGSMTPALTAYATGQMFYFTAAGANTGAVTLNIDSLGAKAVTRDGSTALISGDIQSGEVCVVVYDGTRFQLVNASNSFGALSATTLAVSSTSTFTGTATFNGAANLNNTVNLSTLTASTALALDASKNVVSVTNTGSGSNVLATSPTLVTPNLGTPSAIVLTNASGTASININGTVGAATPNTGSFTTLTTSSTVTLNGGTANGVLYLNGSKVATSGTALVFDGSNLGIGVTPTEKLHVSAAAPTQIRVSNTSAANNLLLGVAATTVDIKGENAFPMVFYTSNTERARIDTSGNLSVGANTNPGIRLYVSDGTVNMAAAYPNSTVGYAGTYSNHRYGIITNNVERAMFDVTGFKIGSTANHATTAGTNVISVFNGTAPVGTLANGVSFFSQSGLPRMIDASGNAFTVGYRNIPAVGTKTGSYTLATADVGKYVQVGAGGSITIPDATFAEGDVVSIFNNTSGNITITCTITTAYIGGVDADKATVTLATRGVATVFFISSTVCVINGNVS